MYRRKPHPRPRSRAAFWLMSISLALLLMVSVFASGVALAASNVTGSVFRDYNANGVQDANEPNIAGVTVTAYGAAGTSVGTAISTNVQGATNYSLTWASADVKVRLEFTGITGTSQQGVFGTGAGSGTSIQFVTTGTVANYGINRPSDYCLATANLKLVTTCFDLGDQQTNDPVVVSHNYTAPAGGANTVGTASQVGAAWGVAYRRAANTAVPTPGVIYVAAFAKRQAGYGPQGSGEIYAIQQPGSVAVPFANIPGAGATAHGAPYATDAGFYDVPGKQSLGDLDISEDQKTLYVVNLADRQLYSVTIAGGAVAPHGVIGNPTCVNGVYRPFGLGIRDGLVYVGGVCTAELAGGTPADLHAYVYTFNPATNAVSPAPVLDFPLNYPRGCADLDAGYGNPGAPIQCRPPAPPDAGQGSQADWEPWRGVWPNPGATPPGSGFAPNAGGDQFFTYPQPMLTGIEFVGDDMVVSLRDRMGDQIGYQDNGPNGTFPTRLIEVAAGDVLRAARTGATWTLENNAQGATFGPSAGSNNAQGPGNGEFFAGDNFPSHHDETITGGITIVPGSDEVSAEVMDPTGLFSAGTAWLDTTSGARNRSFSILGTTTALPTRFGKGNGLGDLEAICDSAPVEIGNYVWFDKNKNGIQDPDEQPLQGIILTLVDGAGNPVIDPATGAGATATTDANGQYIFSNGAGTNAANLRYNLPLTENGTYQVRIDTTQPNLATFTVTIPTAGGAPNVTRDSNGVFNTVTKLDSTTAVIGTAGQNNHTFDFGFYVGAPPVVTPTPPSGTPSSSGSGTPQPQPPPPSITKSVNPPFAMPGQDVTWTISLHNGQSVDVHNVSLTDNFDSRLEIRSTKVDTSGGSLVVNGNALTYSIAVMNPGQTINITVVTRIKPGTSVPFIITNTVDCTCGSATATLLSVGSLPSTGFPPPWRDPLLIGMALLIVVFGAGTLLIMQRSRRSRHRT